MNVRKLVFYLSALSAHKIVTSGKPLYMHRNMSTRTRQAPGQQIPLGEGFGSKQDLLHDDFKYRDAKDYNTLPASIRTTRTLMTFKKRLKQWISANIPID